MKFAHLADIHIGAWRDEKLKQINLGTFEKAFDDIIARHVDFIIISGDLFHVNIPDLDSVKRVVVKLQEAKNLEMPVYVVFGSHDYSPNSTSIIDVLVAGGLLTKVMVADTGEGLIKLDFVLDEKTGVKLCGLSGRSYSMDRDYYKILDLKCLEEEKGFRIFVLHTSINELKPTSAAYDEGVQRSYLPRGFNYYAGGHIHEYIQDSDEEYGKIAYPGTLFGSSFSDLESVAKGMKRGYIIVDFDDKVQKISFIETTHPKIEYHRVSGENRTSQELSRMLRELINDVDPKDKIMLLKVEGTLSMGLVSDIDWDEIHDKLTEKGSQFVYINRRGLSTKESAEIKVAGESTKEIESKILVESLNSFTLPRSYSDETRRWVETQFKGEKGFKLASKLLEVLKTEKQEGETNSDFSERVRKEVLQLLPQEEHKVILKKLHLKNIRSYRDETIEFRDGITLFEGDIGSGKSSILNAVEFAFFGLGDQNGSHLLRVGEKEGKVELTILVNDKKYTFGRSLAKKRNNVSQESCYITEDNTATSYNATEMKRRALQILNFKEPTNPRSQSVIYRYAVFTPQEQMREVIRLKPEARKETLRKALGVEEYSIAVGNASAVLTDLRSEVRALESSRAEAERIQEKLAGEKVKIDEINGKIKESRGSLVEISRKKQRVKEDLDRKKVEEEDYRQHNQRYQLLEQEKRQLDINIASNTKSLVETKDKLRLAEKAKETCEVLSPQYEELRQVKSDLPKLQRRNELFNSLKQKIEIIKIEVNSKRENLKTQFEAKEAEIIDISVRIKALEAKIAKLPDLASRISELETQTSQIEALREENIRTQNSQKVIQQEIKQFEAQKKEKQEEWSTVSSIGIGAMCPHCQQELSENHYKLLETKIADEIKGIDGQIHEKRDTLAAVTKEISAEKALLMELGQKERTLNGLRIEQAELVKDQETHGRYIDQEVEAKGRKSELETLLGNDSFAKAQNEEIKTLETEKNKLMSDVEKYNELRKKVDEFESMQIESEYIQAKTIAERIPELTASYSGLESEKGSLNDSLLKNKEFLGSLVGKIKKYEGISEQLTRLLEAEKALLQDEATQNALIKAYNNDIEASDERVKDLQIDLLRHRENLIQVETLQIVEIWLRDILIPGFQAIEKNILMSLNQEFNKLFKRWFGNLIESEELQGTIDENFTPIVEQSGYELEVESLSGGEKTSVALAYRLALNTIVKQVTSTMKSNLLILDEPTDGFSKEQLFKMRDILNELDCQQIILVSHEKELETVADNIYRVRKEGNTSTITPPT